MTKKEPIADCLDNGITSANTLDISSYFSPTKQPSSKDIEDRKNSSVSPSVQTSSNDFDDDFIFNTQMEQNLMKEINSINCNSISSNNIYSNFINNGSETNNCLNMKATNSAVNQYPNNSFKNIPNDSKSTKVSLDCKQNLNFNSVFKSLKSNANFCYNSNESERTNVCDISKVPVSDFVQNKNCVSVSNPDDIFDDDLDDVLAGVDI